MTISTATLVFCLIALLFITGRLVINKKTTSKRLNRKDAIIEEITISIHNLQEALSIADPKSRLDQLIKNISAPRMYNTKIIHIEKDIYQVYFKNYFDGLQAEASSLDDLLALDMKPIYLKDFLEKNLDFKEKSLIIINKAISSSKTYDELRDLVFRILEWRPVNVFWKDEVVKSAKLKGSQISFADMNKERALLAQCAQRAPMSSEEAERIQAKVDDIFEIFERDVIAKDDKNKLFQSAQYSLQNALHVLNQSSKVSEIKKIYQTCLEKYNAVYNTPQTISEGIKVVAA